MRFQHYIGIDYSSAQTITSRLKALQVYEAIDDAEPKKIHTPSEGAKKGHGWRLGSIVIRSLYQKGR